MTDEVLRVTDGDEAFTTVTPASNIRLTYDGSDDSYRISLIASPHYTLFVQSYLDTNTSRVTIKDNKSNQVFEMDVDEVTIGFQTKMPEPNWYNE